MIYQNPVRKHNRRQNMDDSGHGLRVTIILAVGQHSFLIQFFDTCKYSGLILAGNFASTYKF